jgi:NAD(P)-dependent dehydrogenase (short-subunit alcohol dehydrogenase family)
MGLEQRQTALITGGSRGIGAATALALADHGFDVAFTYRNKVARAAEVAEEVRQKGVRALSISCDITKQEEVKHLVTTLKGWSDHLNLVVLNASGGLERDLIASDPQYPMRINRDAQIAIVDGTLPLLVEGSTIVFVTSHWAHMYGKVENLPAYETVAETKYAGEQALRIRQDEFTQLGIRLIIVTGDLVEGTITPKLLERTAPGLASQRRRATGELPTASDMGNAIATAAIDTNLPGGYTVVIGGSLESLPSLPANVHKNIEQQ